MPTCSCSAFSSTLSERRSLASSAPSGSSSSSTAGLQHQRPGQRDPLLLAAGQLARAPLGERGQLDQVQRLADPAGHLGLGQLAVAQAERHVVEHGQEREQRVALEHRVDVALVRRDAGHVDAVEQDLARGRLLEARRSAAGWWSCRSRTGPSSEKNSPLAIVQVDVVDRDLGEPLGQRDQLDLRHQPSALPPFCLGSQSAGAACSRPPAPASRRTRAGPRQTACSARRPAPGPRPGRPARSGPSARRAARTGRSRSRPASTARNSPAACPASTSEAITSRQRSSDFCRTLATSGLRAACAQKSSQSGQELSGSRVGLGQAAHRDDLLEPLGGGGQLGHPPLAAAYQVSS